MTYTVTKNIQQNEKENTKEEINIQSQIIAHVVQQQILRYGQQLSLTAQHWQSIEQINRSWQHDINNLIMLFPHFSNVSIYLLKQQPTLTVNNQLLHFYNNDRELRQQAKHLSLLNKELNKSEQNSIIQSKHETQTNNQVIAYQYVPIFNGQELIGYLQATLHISKLLEQQVVTFQITYPFSLSEEGRSIYSVLPNNVMINEITQQFTIPLLGHHWKLMVWPLHKNQLYRYVAIIGLLFSTLLTLLFYSLCMNKEIKEKLNVKKLHLIAMNKDFKASKSKLIQSNKLSSLGEIATGIAHEINQPLQVICIHAEICQESLQKQDYRLVNKSFSTVISQVERIEKIVKQVGSFGRDSEFDSYNLEPPAKIFENVIDIVINQYNQENVELRQVLPSSLPPILCNKIQIEQVLVNLLINAKDAVEECDEKVVFIKAHDKKGKLYIEVSDSGSGISPCKLDEIFTPFYTTKALGRGTGLGLSISDSIIHQHKGEFLVSSELTKGSTFTVILPLNN